MALIINLIFAADSVLFIGSILGICDLPIQSGKMTNVRIDEHLGGDGFFDKNNTDFKIENSYDYLLLYEIVVEGSLEIWIFYILKYIFDLFQYVRSSLRETILFNSHYFI